MPGKRGRQRRIKKTRKRRRKEGEKKCGRVEHC
jgi:hypothetical protein